MVPVNDRTDLSYPITKDVYEKLEQYIKDIRFGSVTLIIQDGNIIQIEKNEKVRFK